MKRIFFVFLCCFLFTASAFAQIPVNQQQEEIKTAEAGVFFAPIMQTLNLSLDNLSFLRRYNRPLEFTLSLANNTGVSLDFIAYASHINQRNGDFEAASILPDTEMYLTTEEDAQNLSALLKRLAQENYANENFFGVIARFNGLQQEYVLPEEISIPKVKQYVVKDGELLSDVAKSFYNDESKVDFLAAANSIIKPYQIIKDQIILVPEISGESGSVVIKSDSYKVSKGDTIKAIAEKAYGTEGALSGEMLLVWHNCLKKEYIISAKHVLVIPALQEKHQVQEANTWEKISAKYYTDDSGAKMLQTLNERLVVGQEIFVPKVLKPEFSCAPWITTKEKSFSLKPRESKEVLFQVNLPRGGNFGGTYSAMVTLEQQNKADDSSGGGLRTTLNTAYNSVLILNIESRRPLAKTAELHSFEIQKKNGLTGLVFGLKDLGRTQIQVRRSELRVMREDRSLVFEPMPLGAGPRIVLPQGRIELGTAIPVLPAGKYIAQARVDYGGRRPGFMETNFEIGDVLQDANKTRTVSIIVETKDKEDDITFPVDSRRKNLRAISQIQVKNLEARPIKCSVQIVGFEGLDSSFLAMDVLEVRPTEIVLQPFKSKTLNVILRDSEPKNGGRYARLEISAQLVEQAEAAIKIEPTKRFVDLYILGTSSEYKQAYSMAVAIDMDVVESYHMASSTGNWAQSDEMTFDIVLTGTQLTGTVVLSNKDSNRPVKDGWFVLGTKTGTLTYGVKDDAFSYAFLGTAPVANTDYVLLSIVDPWPQTGSTILNNNVHTDATGAFNATGTTDYNKDLINAKTWLVLKSDWNGTQMTGWHPASYLFETGLMDYYDSVK